MSDGGWTVGTLREHFELALEASNQKTAASVESLKKALDVLEGHVASMFKVSNEASKTEFASQKDAVAAALAAAKEAVVKAETTIQERFASVNEFRQTLSDQAKTFMPRSEAEAQNTALGDRLNMAIQRIEKVEIRLETTDASATGMKHTKDDTRTTIAAIIALVGLAVAVASFFFKGR